MLKNELLVMKHTYRDKVRGGRNGWVKLVSGLALVAFGFLIAWRMGAFDALAVDNLDSIDAWFESLGWWAPAVFILLWVAACVFFLPGLVLSISGGLIFGAVWGTVWTTIGANLGAVAAFLIGRYVARDLVEGMVERNAVLKKIERILYDDAALLPLQWQHLAWAARRNVNIEPVVNVIDMPYLGDLVIE